MRRPLTLLCVVAVAAGLAACGEKDESAATAPIGGTGSGSQGSGNDGTGTQTQGDDPESQINNAVIEVVGGNDAKLVCEELATSVYVKHSYGDVSGCRAAVAKRDGADRVYLYQYLVFCAHALFG